MSNIQIKNADLLKLEKLLQQNKDMYEYISSTYSLKNDLVEITDGRRATRTLINRELDKAKSHIINDYSQLKTKFSNEIHELIETKQSLQTDIQILKQELNKLENLSNHIAELERIMEADEENESAYNQILEITEENNIDSISEKIDQINKFYTYLFQKIEDKDSITERTKNEIKDIHSNYLEIFTSIEDEDSNYEIITNKINKISELYDDYFDPSDDDGQSKKERLALFNKNLDAYHDKVIGNPNKKTPSLESKINDQLERFKTIEKEAKSVIGLSSDAGLAGGFSLKVREAKAGRWTSLGAFIVFIIAIIILNTYLFDINDFKNLSWNSFLFKLTLNSPFIWLATIANINLNKFSRLEQEYSHKESLARSFERYKSAIQDLPNIKKEDSNKLQLQLMEACIHALKLNPAESSDTAKADISFLPNTNSPKNTDTSPH